MSSWLGSVLFQESLCASQQIYFIEILKTLTAKCVDELRIHPEKGFMIVKGNSHVIGERLEQEISSNIFLWAAVFNATRPTVVLIVSVLDFMQYLFSFIRRNSIFNSTKTKKT
jgi:hypothetical protein